MKIKFLLLIMVVFSWSCNSNYEKSSEDAAPYEESETQRSEEMAKSEYSNDKIDPSRQQKVTSTKDIGTAVKEPANIEKSYFKQRQAKNLTDSMYLTNVWLSKKFIKTADLRFKVNNVEKSTRTIEQLTLKLRGYIQQSQVNSNYVSSKNIEISKDTVMQVQEYYVDNNMIIRVPSVFFDSVLTEIGKLHIYLDHREVKTEDVSTTFLRNKLKEEKRTEYEKRIQKAVDKAPRKLDDIVLAERQASDLADIAIDKKIDNYQLQDRIDYSTIVLSFYQSNTIHKEFIENTRLTDYQPNFWQKAWKAIQVGWKVILEIIIGLLYLWPLYIVAILVYYVVKYIRKKIKK